MTCGSEMLQDWDGEGWKQERMTAMTQRAMQDACVERRTKTLPSPCVRGNMETGGRTRRERKSSIARRSEREPKKSQMDTRGKRKKRRDSWKVRGDKVGGGRIVLTDCPQARAIHFLDTAVQPDGAARHASVTSSRGSRSREAGRSRRGSVGAQGTAARASASGKFLSCSGYASRGGSFQWKSSFRAHPSPWLAGWR